MDGVNQRNEGLTKGNLVIVQIQIVKSKKENLARNLPP